jgi:hypothetical protein
MSLSLKQKILNYKSSDESDDSEIVTIKKSKSKKSININIEFYSVYKQSKKNHINNREMCKHVNIHNTKNNYYFEPEKYQQVSSNYGLKYLPNSNVYDSFNG